MGRELWGLGDDRAKQRRARVEDLLSMPHGGTGVIAEGFRLLPELVQPLLTHRRQAVWLLPTPDFRRQALCAREGTASIADKTSDPAHALHNLLERDRLFTDRLAEQTRELELRVIAVDTSISEQRLEAKIARVLGLEAERRG